MNFEGNPFFWGFTEQRAIDTLAKQTKATYNEPRETAFQKTALENFFEDNFGLSSNPAFITGATALDPLPYKTPESSTSNETEEEENSNNKETETPIEENTEDVETETEEPTE